MKKVFFIAFLLLAAFCNAQPIVINMPLKGIGGGGGTGTVTNVSALTIGTTGTDLSSTVANASTTPVITLNVPTASATNRGALSAADWTTFNNKADNSNVMHLTGSLNETADGIKTFTQDVFIHTGITAGRGGSNIFSNVAFGDSALRANTTGYQNTALGRLALFLNTTGNKNVAIGDSSLYSNTTAQLLIAIGTQALKNNTTGIQNLAIGSQALYSNTTGLSNTAMGVVALYSNTTGNVNSAYGVQSLFSNTTGGSNSGFGHFSLFSNTTGTQNTGIGRGALYADSSGSNNVGLGFYAGRYIGTGTTANAITNNSIFIGRLTKAAANNQINQIVIGDSTTGDGSNTTVIGNALITQGRMRGKLMVGFKQDNGNVTDSVQTNGYVNAAGYKTPTGTGTKLLTDNGNVLDTSAFTPKVVPLAILATDAVNKLQTDNLIQDATDSIQVSLVNTNNNFVRTEISPGDTLSTIYLDSSSNMRVYVNQNIYGIKTVIGNTTTDNVTYGTENVTTGGSGTNWANNLLVGAVHTTGSTVAFTTTVAAVSTTPYTIIITVTSRTAGSFTVGFGGVTSTAFTATGQYSMVATSTAALIVTPTTDFDGTIVLSVKAITSSILPVGVWANSTSASKTEIRVTQAVENTLVGDDAGRRITSGTKNTALGYRVLYANLSGIGNTGVGDLSLNINNTGSYNTGVGTSTLQNNTTGINNTALGAFALSVNTTGSNNVAFGYGSLQNATTANFNTAFGQGSLQNTTTGANNTSDGYQALFGNTTGGNNTALGYQGGRFIADGTTANSTGANSVFIGYGSKALADAQTNQVVIGYNAVGDGSNTNVLGNSSSISTRIYGATLYKTNSSTTVQWTSGAGSPEGVITANPGSLYTNTSGGANITLYVKESTTGNTGWIAK